MDALNHLSRDGHIYGGQRIENEEHGVLVGSIHSARPVITEGHLVDLTVLFGREMHPGEEIGADHLDDWFRLRGAPPAGSAVLFRTGYDQHWEDAEAFMGIDSGLPGVSLSAARWLTSRGVAYTGTDTAAFEVMPSPFLEVRCHLTVDHGVHILGPLNLIALSSDSCWEFLLIAVPLPLRGGTGSPVRPIAFVPHRQS